MRKRRGFTLIELLAATALAAVLMVAVLASLGALTVKSQQLAAPTTVEGWQGRLADQLEWDLTHARYMKHEEGQLTLVGFGSLEVASPWPTHELGEIVYLVRGDTGQGQLIRYQFTPPGTRGRKWRADVVCAAVAEWRVETMGDPAKYSGGAPQPIPPQIRAVVIADDRRTAILDRVFHVR